MLGYQCFGLTLKEILAVITGGFAVFAMFFGAGNLVFPLLAGKIAHHAFLPYICRPFSNRNYGSFLRLTRHFALSGELPEFF